MPRLVGNMIISALTSTGAFEVLYGEQVVFSKLAQGRMPGVEELLGAVAQAMGQAAH